MLHRRCCSSPAVNPRHASMSIQTSMLAVLVITFVIVNFTHIVRLQGASLAGEDHLGLVGSVLCSIQHVSTKSFPVMTRSGSCSLYNQGTADILQLLTRATMMQRQTSVGRLGIPKILHHIFLDGEAAFWRNATDGDDFSPNYYAHKRKEGERRAAFKHEWKTSCQSAHPDWLVSLTAHACITFVLVIFSHRLMMSPRADLSAPFRRPQCWTSLCAMQYHFWDMDKALIFIKDHYPWFLPTFEGYPDVVAKGALDRTSRLNKLCSVEFNRLPGHAAW